MEENVGICVDYLTRMTKMGARLVLPARALGAASPMYLEAATLGTRGCLTTHYCVLGMHAARGGATCLLPTHYFLPTHC